MRWRMRLSAAIPAEALCSRRSRRVRPWKIGRQRQMPRAFGAEAAMHVNLPLASRSTNAVGERSKSPATPVMSASDPSTRAPASTASTCGRARPYLSVHPNIRAGHLC
jgi:hypothetical protein